MRAPELNFCRLLVYSNLLPQALRRFFAGSPQRDHLFGSWRGGWHGDEGIGRELPLISLSLAASPCRTWCWWLCRQRWCWVLRWCRRGRECVIPALIVHCVIWMKVHVLAAPGARTKKWCSCAPHRTHLAASLPRHVLKVEPLVFRVAYFARSRPVRGAKCSLCTCRAAVRCAPARQEHPALALVAVRLCFFWLESPHWTEAARACGGGALVLAHRARSAELYLLVQCVAFGAVAKRAQLKACQLARAQKFIAKCVRLINWTHLTDALPQVPVLARRADAKAGRPLARREPPERAPGAPLPASLRLELACGASRACRLIEHRLEAAGCAPRAVARISEEGGRLEVLEGLDVLATWAGAGATLVGAPRHVREHSLRTFSALDLRWFVCVPSARACVTSVHRDNVLVIRRLVLAGLAGRADFHANAGTELAARAVAARPVGYLVLPRIA